LKGEGSDAFKACRLEETLAECIKVEVLTEKENDKITNLKSRSAVFIKNKNCDKASIEISQNDPKALNRPFKLWTRLNRLILMQKLFTTMILKTKAISLFFFICMPRLIRCKQQLTR
jgi:hypothetical protein